MPDLIDEVKVNESVLDTLIEGAWGKANEHPRFKEAYAKLKEGQKLLQSVLADCGYAGFRNESTIKLDDVENGHEKYQLTFWNRECYASFEEAEKLGATYESEVTYGYSSCLDCLSAAGTVRECLGSSSDLMVRVTMDDKKFCDIKV